MAKDILKRQEELFEKFVNGTLTPEEEAEFDAIQKDASLKEKRAAQKDGMANFMDILDEDQPVDEAAKQHENLKAEEAPKAKDIDEPEVNEPAGEEKVLDPNDPFEAAEIAKNENMKEANAKPAAFRDEKNRPQTNQEIIEGAVRGRRADLVIPRKGGSGSKMPNLPALKHNSDLDYRAKRMREQALEDESEFNRREKIIAGKYDENMGYGAYAALGDAEKAAARQSYRASGVRSVNNENKRRQDNLIKKGLLEDTPEARMREALPKAPIDLTNEGYAMSGRLNPEQQQIKDQKDAQVKKYLDDLAKEGGDVVQTAGYTPPKDYKRPIGLDDIGVAGPVGERGAAMAAAPGKLPEDMVFDENRFKGLIDLYLKNGKSPEDILKEFEGRAIRPPMPGDQEVTNQDLDAVKGILGMPKSTDGVDLGNDAFSAAQRASDAGLLDTEDPGVQVPMRPKENPNPGKKGLPVSSDYSNKIVDVFPFNDSSIKDYSDKVMPSTLLDDDTIPDYTSKIIPAQFGDPSIKDYSDRIVNSPSTLLDDDTIPDYTSKIIPAQFGDPSIKDYSDKLVYASPLDDPSIKDYSDKLVNTGPLNDPNIPDYSDKIVDVPPADPFEPKQPAPAPAPAPAPSMEKPAVASSPRSHSTPEGRARPITQTELLFNSIRDHYGRMGIDISGPNSPGMVKARNDFTLMQNQWKNMHPAEKDNFINSKIMSHNKISPNPLTGNQQDIDDYKRQRDLDNMDWRGRMQATGFGADDILREGVNQDILDRTGGRGPTFHTNPKYGNVAAADRAYHDWRKGLDPAQTKQHDDFLFPEGRVSPAARMETKRREILDNDMSNPRPSFEAPQYGPGGSLSDNAMREFEKLPREKQARRLGINNIVNPFI